MICAPASMLDAAAKIHGDAYRAEVIAHSQRRGDDICLEEDTLARIRRRAGLPSSVPATRATAAGLWPRLSRFAAALLRWVRSGCPITPEATYSARLRVCHRCPHWCPSTSPTDAATCALCGCLTSLKLRLPSERCPAGHW